MIDSLLTQKGRSGQICSKSQSTFLCLHYISMFSSPFLKAHTTSEINKKWGGVCSLIFKETILLFLNHLDTLSKCRILWNFKQCSWAAIFIPKSDYLTCCHHFRMRSLIVVVVVALLQIGLSVQQFQQQFVPQRRSIGILYKIQQINCQS